MIKELRNRLETLPEEIRTTEFKILGFTDNLSFSEKEISDIENRTMHSIATSMLQEYDTEGNEVSKKEFKNEDARKAELSKRLRVNEDYIKLKEGLLFSQKELKKEKIQLNFLNNRFSAAKYITILKTGGNKT